MFRGSHLLDRLGPLKQFDIFTKWADRVEQNNILFLFLFFFTNTVVQ